MKGARWGAGLLYSLDNSRGRIGLSIMRTRIDPNSSSWSLQMSVAKRAKT